MKKLTLENISQSVALLEKTIPDNLQTRLMAEEVLLDYQDKFGQGQEYDLSIKKFFGLLRISIRIPSQQFNPLEAKPEDEYSILNKLMDYDDSKPNYRYRNGTNEVIFSIRKKEKFKIPGGKLTIAVLLALVLGILCRFLPSNILTFLLEVIIDPISARLPKLVSALTIPLIFISILAGICALDETSSLSTLGTRVLKRFAITILFILAITFPFCIILFPNTLTLSSDGFEMNTLIDIFLQIVPTNFFTPFTEGNAVQVVFIAFVAGVAILMLGDRAQKIRDVIPQLNTIVMQMMKIVANIIPYTVFLSLFKTFVTSDLQSILSVWRIISINYLANIVVTIILLVRLSTLRKVNIKKYIQQISPLLFTAFTTTSTSTGLPIEYKICEEDLKIDKKVYNFWIPLSHAMFSVSVVIPLFAGVFYTAYSMNLTVSLSKLILVVLMIIELTIASPKIPGGIVATYTLLFTEIGFPTDSLGLLMAANIFIINFEVMNEVLIKYCDLKDLTCLLDNKKETKIE